MVQDFFHQTIDMYTVVKVDGARHSQVRWIRGLNIEPKTNGSDDRHLSFPGGINENIYIYAHTEIFANTLINTLIFQFPETS